MKSLLLLLFNILLFSVSAQNRLKIDSSLNSKNIICKDTSFWYDYNDTTSNTLIAYPNNSTVSFIKGINNGDTIQNVLSRISNDTLYLNLFSISYGLRIFLDITVVNGKIESKLEYSQSNINETSVLKINLLELSLNQQHYNENETIIGDLNISYSGKIWDIYSNENTEVSGLLSGSFKTIINYIPNRVTIK